VQSVDKNVPAGKPQPINSWPTAGARAALPPFSPAALSPLPFPFKDPPQSLTARRAAKPLASAVTGAYEPHFTPRALAAKKIAITRWGMTLAGRRWRRAVGLGCCGNCRLEFGCLEFGCLEFGCPGLGCLSFGCLSALGAAASIPLTLSPPFVPHFRFLAMLLAVAFIPPSPSRLAAVGAAIPGLGMSGAKWFLAVFEQTKSLARPTSPLTSSRFARS